MTDLEITKLCAEAMFTALEWKQRLFEYDPLHDDAQAMALVKKRGISVRRYPNEGMWLANLGDDGAGGWSPDLNRAVCEFVAQMQLAKKETA